MLMLQCVGELKKLLQLAAAPNKALHRTLANVAKISVVFAVVPQSRGCAVVVERR
jgi:hypothetical protein